MDERELFERYILLKNNTEYKTAYEEEAKIKIETGRFRSKTKYTRPNQPNEITYQEFHKHHEIKNWKDCEKYEDIKNRKQKPKASDAGASYRGFVIEGYYLVYLMLKFYLLEEIEEIDYFNIETYEDVGYSKNGRKCGIQMKYYSSKIPNAMEHIFSHLHEHIGRLDEIIFLCVGTETCGNVTEEDYTEFFDKKLSTYPPKKENIKHLNKGLEFFYGVDNPDIESADKKKIDTFRDTLTENGTDNYKNYIANFKCEEKRSNVIYKEIDEMACNIAKGKNEFLPFLIKYKLYDKINKSVEDGSKCISKDEVVEIVKETLYLNPDDAKSEADKYAEFLFEGEGDLYENRFSYILELKRLITLMKASNFSTTVKISKKTIGTIMTILNFKKAAHLCGSETGDEDFSYNECDNCWDNVIPGINKFLIYNITIHYGEVYREFQAGELKSILCREKISKKIIEWFMDKNE